MLFRDDLIPQPGEDGLRSRHQSHTLAGLGLGRLAHELLGADGEPIGRHRQGPAGLDPVELCDLRADPLARRVGDQEEALAAAGEDRPCWIGRRDLFVEVAQDLGSAGDHGRPAGLEDVARDAVSVEEDEIEGLVGAVGLGGLAHLVADALALDDRVDEEGRDAPPGRAAGEDGLDDPGDVGATAF